MQISMLVKMSLRPPRSSTNGTSTHRVEYISDLFLNKQVCAQETRTRLTRINN